MRIEAILILEGIYLRAFSGEPFLFTRTILKQLNLGWLDVQKSYYNDRYALLSSNPSPGD